MDHSLDLSGYECPLPLLKTKLYLQSLKPGARVEILCTDPGSVVDFKVFAAQKHHTLKVLENKPGRYRFQLTKQGQQSAPQHVSSKLSALVILSVPPSAASVSRTVWKLCDAWLEQGHGLKGVFFHCDGIYHAWGQPPLTASALRWARFSADQGVPLYFCSAAAQKRGMALDFSASATQSTAQPSIVPGFKAAGWGTLTELMLTTDRILNFGE